MKTKLRTVILAAPALFSAAVFAAPVLTEVTNSENVYIILNDGVATISGSVDSANEKILIEKQVKALGEVDVVRNLLSVV